MKRDEYESSIHLAINKSDSEEKKNKTRGLLERRPGTSGFVGGQGHGRPHRKSPCRPRQLQVVLLLDCDVR